jgi:hypothetical protein
MVRDVLKLVVVLLAAGTMLAFTGMPFWARLPSGMVIGCVIADAWLNRDRGLPS